MMPVAKLPTTTTPLPKEGWTMWEQIRRIIAELMVPSGREIGPVAYAGQQAGHFAIIGMAAGFALVLPFSLPIVPVAFIVAVVYGIGWEIGVQRGTRGADAVRDTLNVGLGAAGPAVMGQEAAWAFFLCAWLPFVLILAFDVLRKP